MTQLTVWELWYFKAVTSYRGKCFQVPTRLTTVTHQIGEYKVDLTRHPKFPRRVGERSFPTLPWSEHAHIIPISRMFDFSESYSPFHVCLTICPFAYLVYATSHLSFVAFYSYLVSWLAMIWACTYYTDFTDGWFLWEL